MLRYGLILAAVLGLVSPAAAHQGSGGLGGIHLNGRHGGMFDGGLLGLFGGFGAELRQDRFEDKFADLMAEYDEGVAEVTDFYNSAEYTEIVDDAERLVGRYDRFVTGVERSVERIDDVITFANDKITDLDELLAEYQERDDISEKRLERIEDWITGTQDFLSLKVDLLTDRQTELQEDLTAYQTFQTTMTNYLTEIVAAGDSTEEASALTAVSVEPLSASVAGVAAAALSATCDVMTGGETLSAAAGAATAAVPEPHTVALAVLASTAAMWFGRRRAR